MPTVGGSIRAPGTPTRSGRPATRWSRPRPGTSCGPSRPFVVEAMVRTMLGYDPAESLSAVAAPVTALVALGAGDPGPRLAELRRAAGRAGCGGVRPDRGRRLREHGAQPAPVPSGRCGRGNPRVAVSPGSGTVGTRRGSCGGARPGARWQAPVAGGDDVAPTSNPTRLGRPDLDGAAPGHGRSCGGRSDRQPRRQAAGLLLQLPGDAVPRWRRPCSCPSDPRLLRPPCHLAGGPHHRRRGLGSPTKPSPGRLIGRSRLRHRPAKESHARRLLAAPPRPRDHAPDRAGRPDPSQRGRRPRRAHPRDAPRRRRVRARRADRARRGADHGGPRRRPAAVPGGGVGRRAPRQAPVRHADPRDHRRGRGHRGHVGSIPPRDAAGRGPRRLLGARHLHAHRRGHVSGGPRRRGRRADRGRPGPRRR